MLYLIDLLWQAANGSMQKGLDPGFRRNDDRVKNQPPKQYLVCCSSTNCVETKMVNFGSGQGRSNGETAGVAALPRRL